MIRGLEPHKVLFRARCEFKMCRPEPSNEDPMEIRRGYQVEIEISVTTEAADLLWDHIIISNFGPTGHSKIRRRGLGLELMLEVEGATTGTPFKGACIKCSKRSPYDSPNPSLLDFVSRTGLVRIKNGKARVAFRFRCLSLHHGTRDTEHR